MIPLSARESVEYKDDDGITWRFKPQYGAMEVRTLGFYDSIKGLPLTEQYDKTAALVDDVLLGWSGGPANLPQFPAINKGELPHPSAFFSLSEMGELLIMWTKANQLTGEEKKVSSSG